MPARHFAIASSIMVAMPARAAALSSTLEFGFRPHEIAHFARDFERFEDADAAAIADPAASLAAPRLPKILLPKRIRTPRSAGRRPTSLRVRRRCDLAAVAEHPHQALADRPRATSISAETLRLRDRAAAAPRRWRSPYAAS